MNDDAREATAHDVTQLLGRVAAGESEAVEELLPLVYEQLRARARAFLRARPADHTMQPTALVHEAYLKLVKVPDANWENRVHFCAVAAKAMRQVLHDRARRRKALKRGGDVQRVDIEQVEHIQTPSGETPVDIVALDDALERLSALDPRQAHIVELRYFGGLSTDQVARMLDVSTRTVQKEWRRIRAWLEWQLSGEA
jgi:RNA polymerase sigma factor (TIGR02999 family)